MFTDEMRLGVEPSVLCWLATADANGQPNGAPKSAVLARLA